MLKWYFLEYIWFKSHAYCSDFRFCFSTSNQHGYSQITSILTPDCDSRRSYSFIHFRVIVWYLWFCLKVRKLRIKLVPTPTAVNHGTHRGKKIHYVTIYSTSTIVVCYFSIISGFINLETICWFLFWFYYHMLLIKLVYGITVRK